MTNIPTYGGLTADQWRDDAWEDRLNHVGERAILDALDHIDRLKAALRVIQNAVSGNSFVQLVANEALEKIND